MPGSFQITRRVAFSETDAAGIAHFANFLYWMEDAEHAFLRSLGASVHESDAMGLRGYPRVSVACEYFSPLRFEEEFTVTLTVRGKTGKSLTYAFEFHKPGETEPVAVGRVTVVHVERLAGSDKMQAAAIPAALADRIEVVPEKTE